LVIGVSQQDPALVARPAESSSLATLDYIETAGVTVTGTFESYWRERSRSFKQNLRTQRNRLTRESIVTRLEAVRDGAAIGAAIDAYGVLESKGWKRDEGTALHPDNVQGRLYRSWFEYLSETGGATVYRYYFNDRLVATDLWVHRNETLVLLKTTYDETEKATSPTMLMRQEIFESVFNEGRFRKIEFYGRVVDWQPRWTSEMRRMYHVTRFRWPWLKTLRQRTRRPEQAAAPEAARDGAPLEG
jgi:hypothetical protein